MTSMSDRVKVTIRNIMHAMALQKSHALLTMLVSIILVFTLNNELKSLWNDFGIASSTIAFLFSLLTMWCTLIFITMSKWIAYLVLPCSLVFLTTIEYMLPKYGVIFDEMLLASILETNLNEISAFFSIYVVVCLLILVGFSTLFVWFVHKRENIRILPSFCLIFIVFLPVATLRVVVYNKHLAISRYLPEAFHTAFFTNASYWPLKQVMNTMGTISRYYTDARRDIQALKSLEDPASTESIFKYDSDKSYTLIVHIGEALRADKIPMNGYYRNTLPQVGNLPNLINFPIVISYGTITRESIVGMLTDATIESRTPHYAPFTSLFNKHGFKTTSITIPRDGSVFDSPNIILESSFKHKIKTRDFDIRTMTPLVLQELKKPSLHKLIYLNNNGNHFDYKYHDDSRFYTPDERNFTRPEAYDVQNFVNAYDNATHETDRFISRIIEDLKDENAVYIYFSDHGESLGEHNRFAHSGPMSAPEQRYVAAFIWFSDTFARNHPEIIENLKNNSLKTLSHDHLYHTIISIGGIQSSIVNPDLDLTNPDAKSFSGNIPKWDEYDRQLRNAKMTDQKGNLIRNHPIH